LLNKRYNLGKGKKFSVYFSGFALFLLSVSLLMLEIMFTRVSKVSFGSDFQFILISSAILSIGLGGIFVYFFYESLISRNNYDKTLQISIILYLFLLLTPFFALHYLINSQLLAKILFFTLTFFVYLVWGVCAGIIFTVYVKRIHLIYFFSMAGSAIGVFLAIFLLDIFGMEKTIILVFALSFLPLLLINFDKKPDAKYLLFLAGLFIAFLVALSYFLPAFSIVCPNQTKPIFSETNSFSQIDTYQLQHGIPYFSTGFGQLPQDVNIYEMKIDCIGTTTFVEFKPKKMEFLEGSLKYLPYTIKNYTNSLIIGSGAGLEVVMSVHAGNGKVTAVEINPLIINRAQELAKDNRSLNIYNHNSVKLSIEEARSFLLKSPDKYDLIYLSSSKRYGGAGLSSYAFLENYLYTKEALKSYFDHLDEDGLFAVADINWFIMRYMENWVLVMDKLGIGFKNNVILVKGDKYSLVIFKKIEFTDEEIKKINENSQKIGLTTLLLRPENLRKFKLNRIDITDNHPFYWNTYSVYSQDYNVNQDTDLTFKNMQFISIKYLFILFFIIAAALIVAFAVPFLLYKNEYRSDLLKYLFYFFFIGVGFIMIELVLIHKFTIFVENPVYALSVVLSTILLFSGIGSYFASKLYNKSKFLVYCAAAILVVIMALYIPFLVYIFAKFSHFSLPFKILLSIVFIALPSFFMGMFFPFGLERVGKFSNRWVPWMWGINGIASTFGGVLSMIVSLIWGFNAALITGAICYIFAVIALKK